jgi:hypothetical protein
MGFNSGLKGLIIAMVFRNSHSPKGSQAVPISPSDSSRPAT